MPTEQSVEYYLNRRKELQQEKDPWNVHFQALAETFLTRKQDFTRLITPGEFLQDEIFDNTGQYAAFLAASMYLSMLWPDSSRTITIRPARQLRKAAGVEEYFRFVTDEVRAAFDAPRAGWQTAFLEFLLDKLVFGTAGLATFDGPDKDDDTLPVVFDAWGIKSMLIDEDARGFVDTIYYSEMMTVRQIMQEYGKDEIAGQVRDMYKNGRLDEKLEVLHVIAPKEYDKTKKGIAGMMFGTIHIDVQHKFAMRRGGFEEMPVAVTRMFKSVSEKYGRSSGMTALPDAVSLNALSEAIIVATEKQLDPPLVVLDDGRLGGGVVDTSPRGITVYNSAGAGMGQTPIYPLFTVGDMKYAKDLQEQLKDSIMQAFFLDRLLDLNNQTQMTAFETSVRNRMRGEALSSIFSRVKMECLVPTIERVFNILWRRGMLGHIKGVTEKRDKWQAVTGAMTKVVPEAVIRAAQEGLDVYEIEFISPAERFMQSEKLQGIFTASDAIVALAGVLPSIVDNLDPDTLAREIYRYSGAPVSSLRTEKALNDFRAALNAQQQAAEQLEGGRQASEIARNMAQARATLGGMNGGGRPKSK